MLNGAVQPGILREFCRLPQTGISRVSLVERQCHLIDQSEDFPVAVISVKECLAISTRSLTAKDTAKVITDNQSLLKKKIYANCGDRTFSSVRKSAA